MKSRVHARSTSDNVKRTAEKVLEKSNMISHKSSPQLRPYIPKETKTVQYRHTLDKLGEMMERVSILQSAATNFSNGSGVNRRLCSGRQSQEQIRFISLNDCERQFKRLVRDLEDQYDELKMKHIIGE